MKFAISAEKLMEESFKTLPQGNGEGSFDPLDAFSKTGEEISAVCETFGGLMDYTPRLLKDAMQWEKCARILDEGTWVDMGGGEYAELPNVENKVMRILLLVSVYEKLKHFDNRINDDLQRGKTDGKIKTWIEFQMTSELESLNDTAKTMGDYGGCGFVRGLEAVKNLLEWYHTDAEFAAHLVNGEQDKTDIPCGNGWGQGGKQLPERLNTPEAKEWLDRARDAGLLDEGYQPTGKLGTRAMQAYFAELFGEKTGIHHGKYAAFGALWGFKRLSQKRYEAREESGSVKGGEEIEAFFGVSHARH